MRFIFIKIRLVIYLFTVASMLTGCFKALNSKTSVNDSQGLGLPPASPSSGLKANQLALLVNDDDPDSVAVADYYKLKRSIPEENIIHINLPLKNQITRTEFAPIKIQIDSMLGPHIQAIALSWTQPSRVDCNSITSAIARGFMGGPCASTCGFADPSPYYNSNSKQPFTDFGFRPTMMLGGKSVDDVKALIDRGLASDGTHPVGNAHIMNTRDATRSLRARIFPTAKLGRIIHPDVDVMITKADYVENTTDTLFYFQGLATVERIDTNHFPPGAVADHLTSYGGILEGSSQMSCLEFIAAGATGTFGTTTEPCAYSVKFPDPEIMIRYYTKGETLVEAYWKSIQQTFQGIFVGDPLANPWMF